MSRTKDAPNKTKNSSSLEHLNANGTAGNRAEGAEVKTKTGQRTEPDEGQCQEEKSIADILSSADEQLVLSRRFAEKLAKK